MKHAVVTGGSRGIGAAIVAALEDAGYRTTAMSRSSGVDVTDAAAVNAAFSALDQPVDILVNNAGIAPSMPFSRMDAAHWQETFDVNVNGAFHCTRAVLPELAKRGGGRVINIASTAGLKGYGYVAAYVASKHALVGLTRALASEYAASDVTINAICPGFAETDLLRESVGNIIEKTGRDEEAARAALAASNPQGRFIQPEEVAAAVLWLVSEEARSVTGQCISISGGETT